MINKNTHIIVMLFKLTILMVIYLFQPDKVLIVGLLSVTFFICSYNSKNQKSIINTLLSTNSVILTLSILIYFLNIPINLYFFLFLTLSVQFLLLLLLNINNKGSSISLLLYTFLPLSIFYSYWDNLLIKITIVFLIPEIYFIYLEKIKTLEQAIKKREKEHIFTYSSLKKVQETINSGGGAEDIYKEIVPSLIPIINACSVGIIRINENKTETLFKTNNFLPIDLCDIEQRDYFIENTDKTPIPEFLKYSRCHKKYISSIIIIPILTRDFNYGFLLAEKRIRSVFFTKKDFTKCLSFINHLTTSLENMEKNRLLIEKIEMDKELEIASEIQRKMIPQNFGQLNNISISVLNKPSKKMSGDYYNVIPIGGDKVLITICDVAGKGIPAAIVTIIINTVINLFARKFEKASKIVSLINITLHSHVEIERFATLSCLIIDKKKGTISYSNAGHHPTLIKRKNRIIELTGMGIPVGIDSKSEYEEVSFLYEKGDTFLLYTDGITESMNQNGDQFGIKRLKDVLLSEEFPTCTNLVTRILEVTENFSYSDYNFDDRTILGVKL